MKYKMTSVKNHKTMTVLAIAALEGVLVTVAILSRRIALADDTKVSHFINTSTQ
jgi:hypothetical protein